MTILDHFNTILAHFEPFLMGTLSKMMGNFKILAKALQRGCVNLII